MVSIFLNRCHLGFKQLMFEHLSQLKEALTQYVRGETKYSYAQAPMLFERWVAETARTVEDDLVHTSGDALVQQVEALT